MKRTNDEIECGRERESAKQRRYSERERAREKWKAAAQTESNAKRVNVQTKG